MALSSTSSLINQVIFEALIKKMIMCISTSDVSTLRSLMKELQDLKGTYSLCFDIKPFDNIKDFEFNKKLFLDKYTHPDDKYEGTLLDYACRKHYIEENKFNIIKFLVEECGFDVNRRNSKTGLTPFLEASKNFYVNYDTFFCMVENGARVEPGDKSEFTFNILWNMGRFSAKSAEELESRQAVLFKCLEMNFFIDLNSREFKYLNAYDSTKTFASVFSYCYDYDFNTDLYKWLKTNGADITRCIDPVLNNYFAKNAFRTSFFPTTNVLSMLKADGFSFTQLDKDGNNVLHLIAKQRREFKKIGVKFNYLESQGVNVLEMLQQKNKDGKLPEDFLDKDKKNSFSCYTKQSGFSKKTSSSSSSSN